MEKYLYDYIDRISPLYRGIDRKTAHEIAAAVLSFKFGLYPNCITSADNAVSGLKGEGPIATLKKALHIIRDRAANLDQSEVKGYSVMTFDPNEDPYLAVHLPPEMIDNREDLALDNAILLCYAVAYQHSPDDGQMLDEHQNFILQTLNPYKEPLGL
jgi:hypothetical protein